MKPIRANQRERRVGREVILCFVWQNIEEIWKGIAIEYYAQSSRLEWMLRAEGIKLPHHLCNTASSALLLLLNGSNIKIIQDVND